MSLRAYLSALKHRSSPGLPKQRFARAISGLSCNAVGHDLWKNAMAVHSFVPTKFIDTTTLGNINQSFQFQNQSEIMLNTGNKIENKIKTGLHLSNMMTSRLREHAKLVEESFGIESMEMTSIIRKRKLKMKKHRYKKRRKLTRIKRRALGK